jgi:hypothetical protein
VADGAGAYRVQVPHGDYVVVFAGTVGGRSVSLQKTVSVSDGGAYDVSAQLDPGSSGPGPQGGTITGMVTDAHTHVPLSGICASLYTTAGVRTADPQACSDSNGSYTMTVASSGSYDVAFSGSPYVAQWYNTQATQGSATAVTVAAGATTPGIDAAMVPQPGNITGMVSDAHTHVALSGICASLYTTAGVRTGDPQACTDTHGSYSMAVASPGSYKVSFSGANYSTQWYNGAATQGAATAVAISPGATTPGIDGALAAVSQPAPTVTGLNPISGPVAGGQTVTIMGTDLAGATSVHFGGVAATLLSDAATQVVVTSPAGAVGTLHVTVTTPAGTSTTGGADQYTYVAPPAAVHVVASLQMHTNEPSNPIETMTVVPAATGNLQVIAVETKFPGTAAFTVASVGGGGVTTWHKAAAYLTMDGFHGQELWWGVVTNAGASTLTVHYTAGAAAGTAASATSIDVQEFASTSGGATIWSLDATGSLDTGVASTTLSYPALTPSTTLELYFGYLAIPGSVPSGGSTPGVVYAIDSRGNWVAFDTSVSSPITPTIPSNAPQTFSSIGLLMKAV